MRKLILLTAVVFILYAVHMENIPVYAQSYQPTPSVIYQHLNSNATTTIKTGAGSVHLITINTKGASSNILTLYDNTTAAGQVIAVLDTTQAVATLIYDVTFINGLTVVQSAGTAADITVAWR